MRSAGRMLPIGFSVLAFLLAFLTCGAAIASDVERQIPVIRDTNDSGVTMEISREGSRQTATPFLTLSEPTVRRIEDRIAETTARLAKRATDAGETVADPIPRVGLGGTPREDSGRPETGLSSRLPASGEITVRGVRNLLKEVRASRKETPVPAGIVAVPEQRLGMADTSPR